MLENNVRVCYSEPEFKNAIIATLKLLASGERFGLRAKSLEKTIFLSAYRHKTLY